MGFSSRDERDLQAEVSALARRKNPLSFAVYDEGDGVMSLYLARLPTRRLVQALYPWARDEALAVLTPLPAPEGCERLPAGGWMAPGEAFLGLSGPIEAVVLRPGVAPEVVDRNLPATLLASPSRCCSDRLGARLALSVDGRGHAVVLAREQSILAAALLPLVQLALKTDSPEHPTAELRAADLTELLTPMAPSTTRRVHVETRRRYRMFNVYTTDSEAGDAVVDRVTWVAPGAGGCWRAQWSW